MTTYDNIEDYIDKRYSKYPFLNNSTMSFDQYTFPNYLIKSLNINISSGKLPLYISKIEANNKIVKIYFSSQQLLMYYTLLDISTLCLILSLYTQQIFDLQGVCAGSILFLETLYSFLYNLIKGSYGGIITFPSNTLIIASLCITCIATTGYKAVNINDKSYTGSITLDFRRNIQLKNLNGLVLSVFGDIDSSRINISKLKIVNNTDMRNKRLIIKHSVLSDLRVISKDGQLKLTGITDDK